MRPIHALLAAAALGLAAVPARAQPSAADNADLKCILAVGAMAASPSANEQIKAFAPMAFTYYYGKLKGRSPGLDVQARLVDLLPSMQGPAAQQELLRCGGELQTVGAEAQAIGQKFKEMAAPAKTNP